VVLVFRIVFLKFYFIVFLENFIRAFLSLHIVGLTFDLVINQGLGKI